MRKTTFVSGALVIGVALFAAGALTPSRGERSGASYGRAAEASDAAFQARLGLSHIQRSRDEANPTFLPRADEVLQRSLELQPEGNLEAFVGMASLANARHDFSTSVEWSRRAIETDPYSADAYGLLGDALFELGRVRAADAAYEEMVARRPDVASYVRVSYALQYRGEVRAAIGAMKLALQAAGPSGETAAWVRHQMADIYAGTLDIEEAARQNRIGISVAPEYVPPAVGLAETFVARGRVAAAIEIMEEAVSHLPSLEYMVTLGELYEAAGRLDDADAQYDSVASKLASYRRNGVLPDADFIIFHADHGSRPNLALREAYSIYRDRPTGKTADALAWMLHSVGRDREASLYAGEAVASPAADSSTFFHAGSIARALGRTTEARDLMRRALELDPRFSPLRAPIARRIARTS